MLSLFYYAVTMKQIRQGTVCMSIQYKCIGIRFQNTQNLAYIHVLFIPPKQLYAASTEAASVGVRVHIRRTYYSNSKVPLLIIITSITPVNVLWSRSEDHHFSNGYSRKVE
jgi:hypothetical protein